MSAWSQDAVRDKYTSVCQVPTRSLADTRHAMQGTGVSVPIISASWAEVDPVRGALGTRALAGFAHTALGAGARLGCPVGFLNPHPRTRLLIFTGERGRE